MKWFIEVSLPQVLKNAWDCQYYTEQIYRAFARYLDRQNAEVKIIAESSGDWGLQYIVIRTDYNCSNIQVLSGIYRSLQLSPLENSNRIHAFKTEVRIYQELDPDLWERLIFVEKHSPRAGGGGGSPALLVGTDAESGFSFVIQNPRSVDSELIQSVLQSRNYEQMPVVLQYRLHPTNQFYCNCKIRGREPKSIDQDALTRFLDGGIEIIL